MDITTTSVQHLGRKQSYMAHMPEAPSFSAAAATAKDAKARLITDLQGLARNHNKRAYVLCADGTVLLVLYQPGGFFYQIVDANRTTPSWTLYSEDASFEDVIASAQNHAQQSYGGILKTIMG